MVETNLCLVGLKFEDFIFMSHFKVGCVGNLNELHVTLLMFCITIECRTVNHSDARFETTAIAVNM